MGYALHKISNLELSRFFQLSFNVRLVRILPPFWLKFYIYLLGFFYFSLKKEDALKIMAAFNHFMRENLPDHLCSRNLLRIFLGIFDHYYEKLLMAHRPLSEIKAFLDASLRIKNKNILDGIARSGKGGILVTGHYGAVEFLPLSLAMQGYKVSMIVRFKTQKLKQELEARARLVNVELIDAGEPRVAFKALKAIKKGRILVTECDEFSEWIPDKRRCVNVFGTPVPQDKTLDFFYRRTRVPVVLALMKRERGGLTMCVEQLTDGSHPISVAKVAWNRLEGYIISCPYQWYQWKGAASELSQYIAAARNDGDNQYQPVPSEYTLSCPCIT